MTDEDFDLLNLLLLKLGAHIGKTYCIIPECLQDLTHITIFDEDGKPERQEFGLDVQDAVEKALKPIPQSIK